MPAVGTAGSREGQPEFLLLFGILGGGDLLTSQFFTFCMPLTFQYAGQSVDNDIEKTANGKTKQGYSE